VEVDGINMLAAISMSSRLTNGRSMIICLLPERLVLLCGVNDDLAASSDLQTCLEAHRNDFMLFD